MRLERMSSRNLEKLDELKEYSPEFEHLDERNIRELRELKEVLDNMDFENDDVKEVFEKARVEAIDDEEDFEKELEEQFEEIRKEREKEQEKERKAQEEQQRLEKEKLEEEKNRKLEEKNKAYIKPQKPLDYIAEINYDISKEVLKSKQDNNINNSAQTYSSEDVKKEIENINSFNSDEIVLKDEARKEDIETIDDNEIINDSIVNSFEKPVLASESYRYQVDSDIINNLVQEDINKAMSNINGTENKLAETNQGDNSGSDTTHGTNDVTEKKEDEFRVTSVSFSQVISPTDKHVKKSEPVEVKTSRMSEEEIKAKTLEDEKRRKQEEITGIRNYIVSHFSLNNVEKSIFYILNDLQGNYVQRSASNKPYNKLFVSQLKQMIPNIDDLLKDYSELKHLNFSDDLFKDISRSGLSYKSMHEIIKNKLRDEKSLNSKKQDIKNAFNYVYGKGSLSRVMDNVKENVSEYKKYYPNIGLLINYYNETKNLIPDALDIEGVASFDSVYNCLFQLYVEKKENELELAKQQEESLKNIQKEINDKINVIVYESSYLTTIEQISDNKEYIKEKETKIQELEEEQKNYEANKQKVLDEIDKINRSNPIIRFLKRNKKKSLTYEIEMINSNLEYNKKSKDLQLEVISECRDRINNYNSRIKELTNLSMDEFKEKLSSVKSNNVPLKDLFLELEKTRVELEKINIKQRELELQNLRSKKYFYQAGDLNIENNISR